MAGAREQRKVVTILFCDVVGSTALGESADPEALRALLARYFERLSAIVEQHGGVVEKFVGDAVMAVFGVPVVHEDDAVRALRAAAEIRAALPELGIEGRIGVNSGEVVVGTEERLATGDAVNVAARLEQAAQAGEVLFGETTYRLARGSVEAEAVEPLALKGKSEPVPAWRLVSVAAETERSLDMPLVGRRQELAQLAEAWERARAEQRCELVTLVGDAGVGKSRLAAEFLAGVEATVARGRCLSYGEGITYWPVVEVLKQLERPPLDPAAEAALDVLLGGEGASSTDEIAWAFRKLLEASSPVIAVFDDIQWGEEAFLDLVEHVALLSTGAPILLICMARPELLDRRAGWGGVMRLQALGEDEVEELIGERIGAELREKVARAAGGNPLFVQEMLAMAGDTDGDVAVPPTLQALLAARLDQLDTGERTVLEHGAVEGEVFHRGAVQALTPEEVTLTPRLTALVRRELVRPDLGLLPGDDAFRFRHLLMRDAAYESTPKSRRARLHEVLAAWLEEHAAALVEVDEVVGYHLEQAYRYQAELGSPDPALAERAAARLSAAGRRALALGDVVAAASLLARAHELSPAPRPEIFMELADALFFQGRMDECEALLEDAVAGAPDRRTELGARLYLVEVRHWQGKGDVADLIPLAEQALEELDPDDDVALMRVWNAFGVVEMEASRYEGERRAYERALHYARRAGDAWFAEVALRMIGGTLIAGPTPVEEALRWFEENSAPRPRLGLRARLEAMRGNFERARELDREARAREEELGEPFSIASGVARGHMIERLAGDLAEAERRARRAQELFAGMSAATWGMEAQLALTLFALGRHDEAEEWARKAEEKAPGDDVDAQIAWRRARATLLAHGGELDEAERLAREAVALSEGTDMLGVSGDAFLTLAEVLEAAGRDARAELEQALALYERKGNVVMAERVRARLA